MNIKDLFLFFVSCVILTGCSVTIKDIPKPMTPLFKSGDVVYHKLDNRKGVVLKRISIIGSPEENGYSVKFLAPLGRYEIVECYEGELEVLPEQPNQKESLDHANQ